MTIFKAVEIGPPLLPILAEVRITHSLGLREGFKHATRGGQMSLITAITTGQIPNFLCSLEYMYVQIKHGKEKENYAWIIP
jgi:hypothetical protein